MDGFGRVSHLRKSHSFFSSFKHAGRGLAAGIIFEDSLRRQAAVFVIMITLALWLHATIGQFVVLLVASAAVVASELINSALEAVADALHPDFSYKIQQAKDMAAAAVLVTSLAAALIGLAILGPPLYEEVQWVASLG